MKNATTMRMGAGDFHLFQILIGFLATPLLLMVVAGALQAMSIV